MQFTPRFSTLAALVFCGFALFAQGSPDSHPRLALVIGNSAYEAAPLGNPVNDARDMAEALRKAGFEVILVLDGDRRQMTAAMNDFGDRLGHDTIGLFFYAGHGVQIKEQNFLIPVRAPITKQEDVEFEAIPLDRVLRTMESAKPFMSLVFLDACRDNPFKSASRSATRGLSVVSVDAATGAGALIAYATSPGDVASDGASRNGTFTSALLKNLASPGIEINQMMVKVRNDVIKASNGSQKPWTNVSLTQEFYFTPPATAALQDQGPAPQPVPNAPDSAPPRPLPPPASNDKPAIFTVANGIGLGLIAAGVASGVISAIAFVDGQAAYQQYLGATDAALISSLRSQAEGSSTLGVGTMIGAGLGIGIGLLLQFIGGQ